MAQTFTHNLLHPRHWLTWSGLGLLWLLVQLPYPVCSGQLKLATALEFFQYRFSDSFGGNPPL